MEGEVGVVVQGEVGEVVMETTEATAGRVHPRGEEAEAEEGVGSGGHGSAPCLCTFVLPR